MKVVRVPPTVDGRTLDPLLEAVGEAQGARALLDARRLRWVDPLGMIVLLGAGTVLRDRSGEPPVLQPPERKDVSGYLARMGFYREAGRIFRMEKTPPSRGSRPSDVLLEITPIAENRDIHSLVDRVQSRAGAILAESLRYPATAVVQFSVVLSEICQNVLEHAAAPGWVAAQVYDWSQRIGRRVLVLGVGDLGQGFRGSLEEEHSARFGDRWGDATALEAAFIHGLTRFPDSGRGQGIQQIRKQVRRWEGAISIRSGTARIADVPEWDEQEPLVEGLPTFPGAQIHLVLPERGVDGA